MAEPDIRAQIEESFGFKLDAPLNPELVPYLEDRAFGQALKHPLVFDVPFVSQLAGRCNAQLLYKQAALARAEEEHDWRTFVYLHERPYRSDALWALLDNEAFKADCTASPEVYWALIRDIWIDTENLWQWGEEVLSHFLLYSDYPGDMMDDEERAIVAGARSVGKPVTIYRGYHETGDEASDLERQHGWSWTQSKAKAEWFAQRLLLPGEAPRVVEAAVHPDDIIAVLLERGEDEVVVDPYGIIIKSTKSS